MCTSHRCYFEELLDELLLDELLLDELLLLLLELLLEEASWDSWCLPATRPLPRPRQGPRPLFAEGASSKSEIYSNAGFSSSSSSVDKHSSI